MSNNSIHSNDPSQDLKSQTKTMISEKAEPSINILSKLKYECQNCGKQIKSEDIKSHLESNCIKISNKPKTLAEEFKTKKKLRKL